jgi:two-component system, OmpR family, response regulator
MAKVLLVEDDAEIAEVAVQVIREKNHIAEHAATVGEALDRLAASDFDLIVLDWNLPDGEGIEVLRSYRKKKGLAPVIMLTGKTTIDDKEEGFEAGADDYLTKPFNARELNARIDALLRRPKEIVEQILVSRHIELRCNSCQVFKHGEEVRLLPKEFALLEFLLRHAGQVFSADQLLERVWRSDSESMRETVVSTVNRLRNKIDEPGEPSIIDNLRGLGYRIPK